MQLNEYLEQLVEANDLRVGLPFALDGIKYEIIQVLTTKCKVKEVRTGKETYKFHNAIRAALKKG